MLKPFTNVIDSVQRYCNVFSLSHFHPCLTLVSKAGASTQLKLTRGSLPTIFVYAKIACQGLKLRGGGWGWGGGIIT
jgi:hypothetical protein